jgi:hypothetical protein
MDDRRNCALAGLRIYLGVIFALGVYPKLVAGPAFAARLNGFLAAVALQSAHPFYKHMLMNAILPHLSTVATLVVVPECVIVRTG